MGRKAREKGDHEGHGRKGQLHLDFLLNLFTRKFIALYESMHIVILTHSFSSVKCGEDITIISTGL